MRRVKAISHDDEVSLVEHLDELRARIVVSLSVFGVAFALCFWQNHLLLELANGPLPSVHDKLLTFGITEPFTTTMTVAAYGGDHPLDADHPLPGLRLPAAGLQQASSGDGHCPCCC